LWERGAGSARGGGAVIRDSPAEDSGLEGVSSLNSSNGNWQGDSEGRQGGAGASGGAGGPLARSWETDGNCRSLQRQLVALNQGAVILFFVCMCVCVVCACGLCVRVSYADTPRSAPQTPVPISSALTPTLSEKQMMESQYTRLLSKGALKTGEDRRSKLDLERGLEDVARQIASLRREVRRLEGGSLNPKPMQDYTVLER